MKVSLPKKTTVKKLGHSEVIDVSALVRKNKEKWINFSLAEVNDCLVRLGIFQGEFHWHKHDREDELFFVLEGLLLLDLEGGTIRLRPGQGYTVPRRVIHRTRAKRKTVVLMVEGKTVQPRGDP
jgi:mannose-6-phosphate isomerase-like protein (cupin superfamily)